MATNISTSFDSIYLTAHLPENVFITTNQSQITIKVEVDGDEVFSSVYYPYNGSIVFRDLRSIVETAMFDQGLDMGNLEIWVNEPGGSSVAVQDVKVICSDFKSPIGSEAFLSQYFLTTRKSALIPRKEYVHLHNYAKANQQGSNHVLIFYTLSYVPNTVFEYDYYFGKIQSTTEKVVSQKLTHSYFKNIVETNKNTGATVLGVEYHIGSREFNIFFTDEEPTDIFDFHNTFFLQETVYLFGATTTKTEIDRSEAIIGRKTQFYDETVNVKHEVETAPMPYDEAFWMQQMFTSNFVNRRLSNGKNAQVLISDITAEVSDSDKELIRLKFCWKYADGTEWL